MIMIILLKAGGSRYYGRIVSITCCVFSTGRVRLRGQLHDVHVLGVALLLPGRHPGPGLRPLRLWVGNTRGNHAHTRTHTRTRTHTH